MNEPPVTTGSGGQASIPRQGRRRRLASGDENPEWSPPAPSTAGRTRYVLVLLQQPDDENCEIDRELASHLARLFRHEFPKPTPETVELDVWLESPGGDANAAYKIGVLLREYASTISVVIPDYAKSAATLLALSADRIYMAPAAELGPLDAQVEYERESTTVSALDLQNSLERVSQTALLSTLSGGEMVVSETQLSRVESLKAMIDFSTQLFQPLVAKMDPTLIVNAGSQLEATEKYGEDLLRLRNSDLLDSEASMPSARTLVKDYPNHGFVITRKEARRIGLPARPLSEYAGAEDVQILHEAVEDSGKTRIELRRHPEEGHDDAHQAHPIAADRTNEE